MHIAEIAQTAHKAGATGWTNPAIPRKTLVRTADGFALETPKGVRTPVAGKTLPPDGWTAVAIGGK